MRSGFARRGPTYPMIPHMPSTSLWKRKSPAFATPRVGGRSTELSSNQVADRSRQLLCLLEIARFSQDTDDRLGPGGTDENAPLSRQFLVRSLHFREQGRGQALRRDRDVFLDLRVARHDGGGLGERPPSQRTAEEEGCGQAVAGHVVAEVDDVARLLPAEETAAFAERLEHIAVADVRDDDLDSALAHQLVEAEVRHHCDRDQVDFEIEREHRDDLVAVDRIPLRVDSEHAVAVAVEGDPEVEAVRGHDALEEREVGRAAADVDVLAVGVGGDRGHLGAELLESPWRDSRVGAVRTVDCDLQAAQAAPEALDDVLQVAVGGDSYAVDLSRASGRWRIEQRLDLFLGGVGELAPLGVEELDSVVLRRVV